MRNLKLGSDLTLPENAVTQTLACIGRKGAGKTYLAQLLAEQMLDIHAQVVVIDPVGNWYGLRVAADGRGKGKDIFIAGGERGDVPVLPESGARFARLVVEKNVSMVLDVSGFRQGERKRFAADFAEEFFHLKKSQRSAVHLFVEEAQMFAPQRTGNDEARMLGAFENIIRLGRNYGIGATLITQRPQSVNKEVLSQVECLCVLQVNGAHERKALEEWVQEAGADRKLVGELPGLAQGEGYVWSPSWLRMYRRVHFAKKTTFDASATPEVGRAARAALLSAIDVDLLKADLKEVIDRAEKDDPKALRRRIAELERAQQSGGETDRISQAKLDDMIVRMGEKDARIVSLNQALDQREKLCRLLQGYVTAIQKIQVPAEALEPVPFAVGLPATAWLPVFQPSPTVRTPAGRSEAPRAESNGTLKAGARRMLAALCQWFPAGRTEAQLAAQVQMKRSGGTWGAYKSMLKTQGLLEFRGDLWFATERGIEVMGADTPPVPSTTDEVVQLWGSKLKRGARDMLDVLVEAGGSSVTREQLAAAVHIEVTGGTFGAYLSMLKQTGLIVVDGAGIRANRETMFL